MTNTLFDKYRKVIEQTFIPIFAKDDYDTEILLKGCELAGVKVIEYTLRRDDAAQVIPTLKDRYPDNVIFVGSTIDDDAIVLQMKEKYPQLMRIDEIAPYADGFVSMLPYTDETLDKYRKTHISIPAAETSGEAFRQMKSGATFIKTCGPDFSFSKTLHAVPTFNYCPTFITGGVNRDRMDEAFEAGNILCAAGLEVVLKGEKLEKLTAERVAELVSLYINTATYKQILSIAQGVSYVEQKEEGIHFHRFTPVEERKYDGSEFHPKQYATAGVRLHFKTNSTQLFMRVSTSAGSSREFFAHDILVNGAWIGSLKNTTERAYGEFEQEFELGEGIKDVCIHFPWSVCSVLKEFCLDDGSFVEPVKKDKKLLVFGDSITQGFDAKHPINRYAANLADALEAEEFNKAVGGEVFCPWLAESKNNLEPDYISVAYGTNHWLGSSPEELASACEEFFDKLVAHYPNTSIFVFTPIWRKDCTDITRFKSFEEIGEIIADIAKKYEQVTCFSGRNFVPEDENLFADRYLHPNDAGFKHYTEGIKKALGL